MTRVLLRRLLVVAIVVAGSVRIVSTYRVYNQTYDEPAHIGAGMEWLSKGEYAYEQQHPPLARIFCALGLYAKGLRSTGRAGIYAEGNVLLYSDGRLDDNLVAARSGILVFYFLGCAAVYFWARHLLGSWAGAAAVLQFGNLPPVLAHAGLATTDFGVAATIAAALFLFTLWLEHPSIPRSLAVGAAIAAAIVSKFSAVLYLFSSLPVLAALWYWRNPSASIARRGLPLLALVLSSAFTMWAVYRFSVDSVAASKAAQEIKASTEPVGVKGRLIHLALDTPLPAGKLFWGIGSAFLHGRKGHSSYLFGEVRQFGWWYFFPVVLGVKTPLGFLLLFAAGAAGAVYFRLGSFGWQILAPAGAAVAILFSALFSTINLGVRHILPVYAPMAVAAGAAAFWLWQSPRYRIAARAVVVLLLAWQVIGSASAHSDYLPYFNEAAGNHPERILAESDLDWGQDITRLSRLAARNKIPRLWIRYFGSVELERHGLPPLQLLPPAKPVTGWVAISMHWLQVHPTDYAWLQAHPWQPAGRSIRLYYVPEGP